MQLQMQDHRFQINRNLRTVPIYMIVFNRYQWPIAIIELMSICHPFFELISN